jgi:hypothetical protein
MPVLKSGCTHATIFSREVHIGQTDFTRFMKDVFREFGLAVIFFGDRDNLFRRKIARHFLKHLLLVGQIKMHAECGFLHVNHNLGVSVNFSSSLNQLNLTSL